MDYKVEEYEAGSWFEKLGLAKPEKNSFLPENIMEAERQEDLIFTDNLIELEKHFRLNQLNVEILGENPKLLRSRKNADIYLPAIYYSLSTLIENPIIVTLSLNIISNYLYEELKGTIGKKEVHIEFHLETKKKGNII